MQRLCAQRSLPRDSRALREISAKSRFFFDLHLADILERLLQATPAQKKTYFCAVPQ